jgi:arsenate reductase (thioredoxin)
MTEPTSAPIRVLFVCVHNSARSLMAEALLRHRGGEAFAAYSAGTEAGGVNPLTLHALEESDIPIDGLESKSVQAMVGRSFDYVVTVCDPAREACPYFPGARRTLHWSFDDPAAAEGTPDERLATFRRVLGEIGRHIDEFVQTTVREDERRAVGTGG